MVCGLGNECPIPSYDIINLVLNDYNMISYFKFESKSTWTLHIMIFDIPCHVELSRQVVWHNSSDHSHLIQYNYKSSCKHSHLNKILLVWGYKLLHLDCLVLNKSKIDTSMIDFKESAMKFQPWEPLIVILKMSWIYIKETHFPQKFPHCLIEKMKKSYPKKISISHPIFCTCLGRKKLMATHSIILKRS